MIHKAYRQSKIMYGHSRTQVSYNKETSINCWFDFLNTLPSNYWFEFYSDKREAWPKFVRRPHKCIVQEGQPASFKCKVTAASPPTITWYFKGQALTPSLKYMPKYSGKDYELRIGRTKISEDKGEYVVKAVNSWGSAEESAFLVIEGWIEIENFL